LSGTPRDVHDDHAEKDPDVIRPVDDEEVSNDSNESE
jgi:hypothetical protein